MNQISFILDKAFTSSLPDIEDAGIFLRTDIQEFLQRKDFVVSKSCSGKDFNSAFIAGVLLSPSHAHLKDQLLDQCKRLLPHFSDDMIFTGTQSEGSTANWITRATISFSRLIAEQASRAEQENAEIRVLYEKAQSAIFEMERPKEAAYTPKIIFQVLPGKRQNNLTTAPVEIRYNRECGALHAVDLFFDKSPYIVSGADIVVDLTGALTGRKLAAWAVPEAKLLEGWNRFYCPASDETIGEGVCVSVRATSGKAQFTLRSGATVGNPDSITTYSEDQGPVALRLWSGLLGVKLPQTRPGHFVEDENRINPAAVSHAELLQLGSSVIKEDTDLVSWEEKHVGLLVHPRGINPVLACIPMLHVTDLSAIRITCKLAHPDAPTTDFCAWVVRADEKLSIKSPAQSHEGSLSRFLSSRRNGRGSKSALVPPNVSWLTLQGGQEGEIYFAVDPAYTGSLELLLATRNHTKVNHFAWAVFTDLRFEISLP